MKELIKNIPMSEAVSLAGLVEVAPGKIVSRTFVQRPEMTITLFSFAAINPHLVWDFCTSLHIAAHAWILAGARAIWRKNFSARNLDKNERSWTFKGCLSPIEGHLKKSFKPASILVQTI